MTASNLPREARALLDAIAVGESDPMAKSEGISPYFILVGGGSFEGMPNREGYNGFPEWEGRQFSTGISHAAGRYQDQPGTWKAIVGMFPQGTTPDFRNPGDQDWGNWFLAQHDYHARTGASLLNALRTGNIGDIGGILQPTWTSLSDDTFPDRYRAALATYPVGAPTPAAGGQTMTTDTNWLTGAAASPYLPIIAGLVRGVVGIASGFGFTWALAVSGDQITMIATALVAVGMLGWSVWQKISSIRESRKAEVAAAVASVEQGVPVTVTVTPAGQQNIATRVSAAEANAAPAVPIDVKPLPPAGEIK